MKPFLRAKLPKQIAILIWEFRAVSVSFSLFSFQIFIGFRARVFQEVFIYIRWITVSASRSVYLQVDIVVQVLSGINLIAK